MPKMTMPQFNTLKKVMQQTESDNDHVALMALRKANATLKECGCNWDEVFKRLVKVEVPFEPYVSDRADDEVANIREAFEVVEASDPRGSFADFIASLREQWDVRQHLTISQKEALFAAAKKAQRKR